MLEWIADPSAWVALATLTLLEIVLGIDNIIFISIWWVACRKPSARKRASWGWGSPWAPASCCCSPWPG